MRLDMAYSVILRGIGALAWLLFVRRLAQMLSLHDLGLVLFAITVIGFGASTVSAGWSQCILRNGSRLSEQQSYETLASLRSEGLRRALFLSLVISIIIVALSMLGIADAFLPVSIGCLVAGGIVLSTYIAIESAALRAMGVLFVPLLGHGILRAGIPLGLIYLWSVPQHLAATTVIAFFLLGLCVSAILVWIRVLQFQFLKPAKSLPDISKQRRLAQKLGLAGVSWNVFQHLDIFLLGILTSPTDASLYLVARKLVAPIALVYDGLRMATAPRLSAAFANGNTAFLSAAQEVNAVFFFLGMLAITVVALFAEIIFGFFGITTQPVKLIFFSLLAGQAGVAIFGAAGMMMSMGDQADARFRLLWFGMPVAVLFLAPAAVAGPSKLAAGYAICQLSVAAVSAFLIFRRHGVQSTAFTLLKLRFILRI